MHPAIDPRIQTVQVRDDGLVGTFYMPRTPPPWTCRLPGSCSRR
jgi:hypothetical protein